MSAKAAISAYRESLRAVSLAFKGMFGGFQKRSVQD
ncbi:unnamed protein product [Kuraishia capsulata CBS 1993]|uniref:Uncharacterized protein n=1 Tax=Kuraishia capsulata CBS 1993 TaxID=1382522 RepID=W6MQ81_9ASCO|nr:uncharacterized protein KUCA_T00004879001 [Kuraishia capsulata CBS 1993]CDK28894.1 unnamed protein product [Kuraishia capsulata CBS 1993]